MSLRFLIEILYSVTASSIQRETGLRVVLQPSVRSQRNGDL